MKNEVLSMVFNIIILRGTYGVSYYVIQLLLLGGEHFKSYFRLITIQFEEVIGGIESYLQRQNHTRGCISPRERLCVTLRYDALVFVFISLFFKFNDYNLALVRILAKKCAKLFHPTSKLYVLYQN